MAMEDYMSRSPSGKAWHYWNTVAPTNAEAQALAKSIGLSFPTGRHNITQGIGYPLRRLVVTGQDALENIRLLLGPQWADDEGWDNTRIQVLMGAPPEGSPAFTMAQYTDHGCPQWTPRAPSPEEEETLKLWRRCRA